MGRSPDRSIAAILGVAAVVVTTIEFGVLRGLRGPGLLQAGPEIVATLLVTATIGWAGGHMVSSGGWRRAIAVGGGVGALWFPLFYVTWLTAGLVDVVLNGDLAESDLGSGIAAASFLIAWVVWLYSLVVAVPVAIAWGILTRLMTRRIVPHLPWLATGSPAR